LQDLQAIPSQISQAIPLQVQILQIELHDENETISSTSEQTELHDEN